jgi:hypothetical protein
MLFNVFYVFDIDAAARRPLAAIPTRPSVRSRRDRSPAQRAPGRRSVRVSLARTMKLDVVMMPAPCWSTTTCKAFRAKLIDEAVLGAGVEVMLLSDIAGLLAPSALPE